MQLFICIFMGYALGSISPSYIVGRVRGVDIRRTGTHSLGASNTFLHFGRWWGVLVMAFDIFKAFAAVKLAQMLFSGVVHAPLISGSAAVLGHCFPVYLGFVGGRGLATLGGLVLALSPKLFLILLLTCAAFAVVTNYGCVLSISAGALVPLFVGIYTVSMSAMLICAVPCACVLYKHTENVRRIIKGEEAQLREFIKRYVVKNKE